MTRSLLSLFDISSEELSSILQLIEGYKKKITNREDLTSLQSTVLGLLFEKPSTRTRTGFETAIHRLGGEALYLQTDNLQASRGEPIKDTARVLGSYLDGIIARVYAHDTLCQLEKYAAIPVINALSDLEHPTQVISDIFTLRELKHDLSGLTLAYIGDGNNVCNSLIIGTALTGIQMRIACPKGYEPHAEIIQRARALQEDSGASLSITREPSEAALEADVLYTDVWVSMGKEKEQGKRLRDFRGYQINEDLVKKASPDAIAMHCLPAHRGLEITDEVIEGSQSVVWQQAENKLHGAAGILAFFIHPKRGVKNP